jgi:hypothetical protein
VTVSIRAQGVPTAANTNVNALNPSPPAGWVSGDRSYLIVTLKSSTTSGNAPTCATPSGWTLDSTASGAGSATPANDVGPGKLFLFYRDDSPSAPGALTVTNANNGAATIIIFAKTLANWVTPVATILDDTSQGVNFSPAAGSDIGLTTGDLMVGCHYHSSDGGTISAESFSVPGCTSSFTMTVDRAVTTGFDSRHRVLSAPITAGTSTGSPTHSYTNLQGGTAFTTVLRFRDAAPTTVTGAASLAGAGSLVAAGARKVAGFAALSGNGTVAASGVRKVIGSSALVGSGSATGAGTRLTRGTANVAGNGTTTGAGTRYTPGVGALVGAGSVTATGARKAAGTAALTGNGTLTTVGTREVGGTTALVGNGTLTATGTILTGTGTGTSALVGNGTLTATGRRIAPGNASLVATGTLVAAGTRTVRGLTSLVGAGALTVVISADYVTPDERTATIAADVRAADIEAETRINSIAADPRETAVPAENRTTTT